MTKFIKEAVKTDSTISTMRIAFIWVIRTIIFIAVVSVLAKIYLITIDKVLDLGNVVGIIAALGTVAFGGKALQSFSENSSPISAITNMFKSKEKEVEQADPEKKPEDNR